MRRAPGALSELNGHAAGGEACLWRNSCGQSGQNSGLPHISRLAPLLTCTSSRVSGASISDGNVREEGGTGGKMLAMSHTYTYLRAWQLRPDVVLPC